MNNTKPATVQDYIRWLHDTHQVDAASPRTANHFDSVVSRTKLSFESSPFWTDLTASLPDHNDTYLISTGYPLLTALDPPAILTKPFKSFLEKTFRRNVLDNTNWPSEPAEGWLLPHNWHSEISDLVRTRLIVKYLDGVRFMIEAITALSQTHNLEFTLSYEAREEGYYAAHVVIHSTADVPKENWDSETIPVALEIQVTTQLQDVIGKLLHKYYEDRRMRASEPDIKWQWNYESDEFLTNYLGHILHYAEGMIMEARNRQAKSPTTEIDKEPVS